MAQYRIEAALFKLPIPWFKKFGHCFWILRETQSNQIVAALHGLATSRRNNMIIPIGFRSYHSLRAYHFVYNKNFAEQYQIDCASFSLPSYITQSVYEGPEVIEKWFNAVDVITNINAKDLDYPRFGINLLASKTVNSNSIYNTLGKVMKIEPYRFPGTILIGFNNIISGI